MPQTQLHDQLLPQLSNLLAKAQQSVDLVSPFLSAPIAAMLAQLATTSTAKWRLLTNLNSAAVARGVLNPLGLRRLQAAGVELLHVDRLHAKVALVDGTYGFLGSANLTNAGLGASQVSNVELSITLDVAAASAAATFVSSWASEATPISSSDIDAAEAAARLLHVAMPRPMAAISEPGAVMTLIDTADDLLHAATSARVWVKAVFGGADRADAKMYDGELIGSSKAGKPSFAPGDLLVMYYKWSSVCCRVVEVVGETLLAPEMLIEQGVSPEDSERWPWATPVRDRLHVPAENGVRLDRFGLTGQSLQRGHCRMPTGGLATFLRELVGAPDD